MRFKGFSKGQVKRFTAGLRIDPGKEADKPSHNNPEYAALIVLGKEDCLYGLFELSCVLDTGSFSGTESSERCAYCRGVARDFCDNYISSGLSPEESAEIFLGEQIKREIAEDALTAEEFAEQHYGLHRVQMDITQISRLTAIDAMVIHRSRNASSRFDENPVYASQYKAPI